MPRHSGRQLRVIREEEIRPELSYLDSLRILS